MLSRREGGLLRRDGGFLRRGGGFLRSLFSKGSRRWAALETSFGSAIFLLNTPDLSSSDPYLPLYPKLSPNYHVLQTGYISNSIFKVGICDCVRHLHYTPCRNYYINDSPRIILCNVRDLITSILCNDAGNYSPKCFYVMANPIHYTRSSGLPSVVTWRAVDYIKLCNEPEI